MKEYKLSDFTSNIYDIRTNEFKNKNFVIVDFYANWCQPCNVLDVILRQINQEMDIEIFKINAEEEYPLTEHFQIKSLPTLIFIYNGNIYTHSGAITKTDLIKKIKQYSKENVLA